MSAATTYILILAVYRTGAVGIEFGDQAACETALAAAITYNKGKYRQTAQGGLVEVGVCVPKASQQEDRR